MIANLKHKILLSSKIWLQAIKVHKLRKLKLGNSHIQLIYKKKLKNTQNSKKNLKEEKTLNLKTSIMPRLQRNIEKLKKQIDDFLNDPK